mmetsp:Transcript_93365/g.190064  ORF Transcript_93365/g.190064 Transcript_93365/m.190064 type:complete len:194 (+) Transcript_93365:394-975(+)
MWGPGPGFAVLELELWLDGVELSGACVDETNGALKMMLPTAGADLWLSEALQFATSTADAEWRGKRGVATAGPTAALQPVHGLSTCLPKDRGLLIPGDRELAPLISLGAKRGEEPPWGRHDASVAPLLPMPRAAVPVGPDREPGWSTDICELCCRNDCRCCFCRCSEQPPEPSPEDRTDVTGALAQAAGKSSG